MGSRTETDLTRVFEGLRMQLERSSRFTDTLDVTAAWQTYDRVLRLVEPRLVELRRAVGLPDEPPALAAWRAQVVTRARYLDRPVPSDRVFSFWNSGEGSAPPLVRACLAQTRKLYPALQVLDGRSARELVEIPDRVAGVLEQDRPAHFSDYVRTRVLEEHGGLWFDATAWVGRNLDVELRDRYLRAGTVFPRWTRRAIANWFIASHPHTVLLGLQRRVLDLWWDANDDLPDYFLYHRIFEVIQELVPEARGQWNAAPALSALDAHLLQLQMMQPWRVDTLPRIARTAPLQKLSYKYDAVPEGSVLAHLVGPYVPAGAAGPADAAAAARTLGGDPGDDAARAVEGARAPS